TNAVRERTAFYRSKPTQHRSQPQKWLGTGRGRKLTILGETSGPRATLLMQFLCCIHFSRLSKDTPAPPPLSSFIPNSLPPASSWRDIAITSTTPEGRS